MIALMSAWLWVKLHRGPQTALRVFLANSTHCTSKPKMCVWFQVMHLPQIKQSKTKDCVLRPWETVNKLICGGGGGKEKDAKAWKYAFIFYVITLKNWSENKNQEFYLLGVFCFYSGNDALFIGLPLTVART